MRHQSRRFWYSVIGAAIACAVVALFCVIKACHLRQAKNQADLPKVLTTLESARENDFIIVEEGMKSFSVYRFEHFVSLTRELPLISKTDGSIIAFYSEDELKGGNFTYPTYPMLACSQQSTNHPDVLSAVASIRQRDEAARIMLIDKSKPSTKIRTVIDLGNNE